MLKSLRPITANAHFKDEIHISNRDAVRDLLIPLDPNHPDSRFIEEAWEGWPHAIRRAMEVEAENASLKADLAVAKAREGALREALQELVDLKLLKDMVGKTPDYLIRQPRAWRLAQQALSTNGRAYAERVRKLEAVAEACASGRCSEARRLLAALEVTADGD
jgi:hypothetical protein